jgi:hypothetical protein
MQLQRTEVYEYTKVLGNSQYILLPFQPYKLYIIIIVVDSALPGILFCIVAEVCLSFVNN